MPKKVRTGIVVSNKMDKSIVVSVQDHKPHSKYGKIMLTSKKFHAHDEDNTCNIGDKVQIIETSPISKTKTWRLVAVLEKAQEAS